ncbi:MAG: hypothetical protein V1921_06470 [Candidatus Altiarchaeota archaeon]
MTGTKIVKLKLENANAPGRLPSLRESTAEKVLSVFMATEYVEPDECYLSFREQTKDLNVTSSQLQKIIRALERGHIKNTTDSHKAGMLVSAFIQNSTETEFHIQSKIPLGCVGYRLQGDKKITIEGDYGDATGWEMKSGSIHVKGHAGMHPGIAMEGGTIIVDGNAGLGTGYVMSGGKIHVKGNVGEETGYKMSNGTIEVDGSSRDQTGFGMHGGTLHIGGNAGKETGNDMGGGIIKVDGKISGISGSYKKGEIWEAEVKVRPK